VEKSLTANHAAGAGHGAGVARIAVFRGPGGDADRIEITAENGVSGRGQGRCPIAALQAHPELVLGRSPFEAESIYDDVASAGGDTAGGLDMAVWDLAGRLLSRPASALLGRRYRARVPVCASFTGVQPPVGFRMWRLDARCTGDLGRAFHCGLRLTAANLEEGLAAGAQLENRALAFWQSPLPESDAAGYRRLRAELAIPIAAAGDCGLDALIRDLVQSSSVDLVVPPIERVGLTGLRRLAYYCWLFCVRLAVECSGSSVSTSAALSAAACFPPVTSAIAAPPPFIVMPADCQGVAQLDRDGMLAVADLPGLGCEAAPPAGAPDIVLGELP
jgi:L-alanine-DL-glutamate epimerase-like enolase superfamily enzyme